MVGAGDLPTSSAVVADIVDVLATVFVAPTIGWRLVAADSSGAGGKCANPLLYQVTCRGQAGRLAQIAASFGAEGVSIESMIQQGRARISLYQ